MIPNATVSYMATRAERQLLEARMARAWTAAETPPTRSPRVRPAPAVRRSLRAVGAWTVAVVRDARRHASAHRATATVR
jgi:hypothetical protein